MHQPIDPPLYRKGQPLIFHAFDEFVTPIADPEWNGRMYIYRCTGLSRQHPNRNISISEPALTPYVAGKWGPPLCEVNATLGGNRHAA